MSSTIANETDADTRNAARADKASRAAEAVEPANPPDGRPPCRPAVPFPPGLVPVRVVRRLNRFTVEALRGDRQEGPLRLHLPNSGRMRELLTPGTPGLAVLDGGGSRRTGGTLLLVRYGGRWVSVDARMPNRLLARCLETGYLPAFRGYTTWRVEAPWGRGRVDFLLSSPEGSSCLVETKSCNLVEGGLALFPDAPTTRGTRHLLELADAVRAGHRAAVVWFVQRDDAGSLAPHRRADPEFARALREAQAAGVEVYAYRCRVDPAGITVLDAIPVDADGGGGS